MSTFYVIGRDFYDRHTERYSIRQFWHDEKGWVSGIANATHAAEPMRLDEDNPQEFCLKVETREDGSQAITEV